MKTAASPSTDLIIFDCGVGFCVHGRLNKSIFSKCYVPLYTVKWIGISDIAYCLNYASTCYMQHALLDEAVMGSKDAANFRVQAQEVKQAFLLW